MQYDIIIVGAGAAGSVLANRLSARPELRILLLEAGPDLIPGHEPADIRSVFPLSAFNQRYMWPDTRVHWQDAHGGIPVPLPQGRILGGSSAVMGMWALRGVPDDYESWERAGAAGWGWQGVLPFFRRLETDIDFDGPLHGKDGPIPIRREPHAAWSPLALAVEREMQRRGVPTIDDLNADFRDGHCVMPNSRFATSRAASGICYLTEDVRARPNLHVLTDRTVTRITFDGRRATGAVVRAPDGTETHFTADETLLAAGALRTPALLLRSGIGPATHLREVGVEVVADLQGVGENLQNHAVLYVCALLNRHGREAPGERPAAATYLRWTSDGGSEADMAMYVRSYLAWHALGRRMASLAPSLQRPNSRGRIRLDAADGAAPPVIEFRLLHDAQDLARLTDGLQRAVALFASDDVQRVCGEPFVLTNASRLARFNRVTRSNDLRARIAAGLADLGPRTGLALLRTLADVQPAQALVANAGELGAFVRESVTGVGHVCGTARMGRVDDALAVCDAQGRVHGLAGLRVGDASLMPTVPSGNTHIPTVMVGEKIADAILRNAA